MLKRDGRLFIRCLTAALVFALFLGTMVYGITAAVYAGGADRAQIPNVLVVDKENSIMSRMVIGVVENSQFAAPLFKVSKAKEKEAMKQFAEGSCSAVIVLPEHFLEDISYGRESRGHIYLSDAVSPYAAVVASAAQFGEKMLAAGQYGVFCGERLLRDYGCTGEEHEQYLLAVNANLLNEALGAGENYYEIILTDYDNTSLDITAYYLSAWFAFLLLLCGLVFGKLYKTDLNTAVYARLAAYGVKNRHFAAGKIIYPFIFLLCLSGGGMVAVGGHQELYLNAGSVCALVTALLLSSLFSFAFAVCMENEVLVTASVAFVSLLLCGGVIPRPELPVAFKVLGDLSPVGVVRTLTASCLGGTVGWQTYMVAAGYLILLGLMTALGLKRLRTGKGAAGR